MLDIPTARANRQARRAAQPAVQMGAGSAVGEPTPAATPTEGATSVAATPPTALSQTTPYEYAGHGSQDPIARQVMKDYWSTPMWGGPGGTTYDTNAYLADAYDKAAGANFNSPLNPSTWGTVFKGQDYADIAEKYKAAGGTYFDQFTPAQQAGVPYNAATGEATPVMNMQTGVPETPTFGPTGKVTGQTPTPVGGTGSYNTLGPDVINKMWR